MPIIEELRDTFERDMDDNVLCLGQNTKAPQCPLGHALHCDVLKTRARVEELYGGHKCFSWNPCFVRAILFGAK